VREIQVGASIEEALHHLVERVPNADLKMMVGSVEILRQTGGNMVETFEGVAETLKNRKKVEGKIKTLTAQGRYQTLMLCAMPFVMLLILYVMNRDYVQPLFTTFLGWLILSVVVLLVVTGYVIINKITHIEV
jgi:tight adherence protein B